MTANLPVLVMLGFLLPTAARPSEDPSVAFARPRLRLVWFDPASAAPFAYAGGAAGLSRLMPIETATMATPSIAANAYASLAKLTDPSGLTKGAGEVSGGPSFGNLVKDAINSLSKSTHNSDLQTHAAANGKANMVDVVTAVAESEVAIDTLVSVRDKVISAYEEIMKMPI